MYLSVSGDLDSFFTIKEDLISLLFLFLPFEELFFPSIMFINKVMLKLHLHLNQETGEQAFVAAVFIYIAQYAFLNKHKYS